MMFNESTGKIEKDRSRLIIVASGLALICVIGLIIAVSYIGSRKPEELKLIGQGNPEFDSYVQSLTVEDLKIKTAERLNTRFAQFNFKLKNSGDRAISGVQLRLVALGYEYEVLKEKYLTPIPGSAKTLPSNQYVSLELYMEPIPDPTEIMHMTVEVTGIQFK
ncbi:MAG: hypothetical protein AB1757_19530 [Acidobacteriota bacterium]